jgi:hypothetical protein
MQSEAALALSAVRLAASVPEVNAQRRFLKCAPSARPGPLLCGHPRLALNDLGKSMAPA